MATGTAPAQGGPSRASKWRRRALIALAAVAIAAIYVVRIRTGMADFGVNYRAGQRLWAGETLYQAGDGHYMFKYLPASALLYLPLAALPLEIAKAIWFVLSLGAMIGAFALVARLVPERRVRRVWVVPALVLAKYFLHELRLGQINILVTFVMLLAVRALRESDEHRGSPAAAGLWVGIATAMKPYSALLFAYLVVKRRWVSAAVGLAILVAALAATSVFYGIGGNVAVLRQWASTLVQSTPALLTNNDNVSVLALFAKWTGDPRRSVVLAGIVLGILAIVMLAVIVRGRGLAAPTVLESAMALTLIPLVSPMGWDYTFLMSLLAVALLCNYFDRFPPGVRLLLVINFAVIGLSLYDVMGRHAYAMFMQWSVTTVNFVLVVAALAWLRFRRVC